MSIVQRAINILTKPKTEWPRIASEPATSGGLMTGYALPLALLPLIGSVIGALLFAGQFSHLGGQIWAYVLIGAVLSLALGLVALFVMSLIANALAPSFGGVSNQTGALKLLVYSATATWVAGFFGFIPGLGALIGLVGFAYAAYLIYLGSTAVMQVPADKAIGYTAVVILIWIVLWFVVLFVIGLILAAVFLGAAAASGGYMLR